MTNQPLTLELTQGALLELYRDPKRREYAQIIARKRKHRWYEWVEVTPRLTSIQEGVSQNDYSLAVLAYQIKKASARKFYGCSELSRLPWKISRLGFKKTARKLSWLLQEPLNGYPITPETPDQGFLFLTGSRENPCIFSGELAHENRWDFKLLRGLTEISGEALLDDISRASIHDFELRKLLCRKRFAPLGNEISRRRELHQKKERHLREWMPSNGFRQHYSVNRHLKKESMKYALVLRVHAGNAITGAGKKGVYNNAMVSAADELADKFDGAYKVEGIEAHFELATDLVRFSQRVRLNNLDSLTGSQVYLNITRDFDFG